MSLAWSSLFIFWPLLGFIYSVLMHVPHWKEKSRPGTLHITLTPCSTGLFLAQWLLALFCRHSKCKPATHSSHMSNPNFRPKSWQSTLLPPGSRAPCGQLLAMPEIIFWMGELSGVCHLVHLFCIHLVANILKIFFVCPILGEHSSKLDKALALVELTFYLGWRFGP